MSEEFNTVPEAVEATQDQTLEVATENTDASETELKGSKLTDAFKVALQACFASKNIKLSKQAAWDLYKELNMTVVDFTVKHKKVSLAGVGVFRIHESKPEGTKEGVFNFVPRFKYSASDRIINHVFKNVDCFVSEEAKQEFFAKAPKEEANSAESTETAPVAEVSLGEDLNSEPDFDID